MLATLRAQIAMFDRRIAELVADHPDGALFRSLPGAGAALVPRLIVAFGTQRERYQSAYEMQCYSGIAPVTEAPVGRANGYTSAWPAPKFLRQTFHGFAPARSSNRSGRELSMSINATRSRNRTTRRSARWPSNGCASSIAAGRTVNPMTRRSICSRC